MSNLLLLAAVAAAAIASTSCGKPQAPGAELTPADTPRGTITGHVHLTGPPPEKEAIALRADPMCAKAAAGRTFMQETVVSSPDGSLANVLVQLSGDFPEVPAPSEPVTIDQKACVYSPRVVGIQLGQPLRVKNSDPGLHNVHGASTGSDRFNVGQPMADIVNTFQLRNEGILRLRCDVHVWMVAYVGVVKHPYFAVTNATGTFMIRGVPAGTHTVEAWHERYGRLTSAVTLEPGGTANVEFTYSGSEQTPDPWP
jgi:plastocyanin